MSTDAAEPLDGFGQLWTLLERAAAGEGDLRVLVRDDPRWDGAHLPVSTYWVGDGERVLFLDCFHRALRENEGGASRAHVLRVGISMLARALVHVEPADQAGGSCRASGTCVDGRDFEAIFAERAGSWAGAEPAKYVDLSSDMSDLFTAGDKAGALAMVEEFGVDALAELLISHGFEPSLFKDEELFELCRPYPMRNPIVSFFTGYAAVQAGRPLKEAMKHLRYAARGGLKEACGYLGCLYRDGAEGELLADLAKAFKWFGKMGREEPKDPSEQFFFLEEDSYEWPFNIYCGKPSGWQWGIVCRLLEGLSEEPDLKAALDAIPGSRKHVQRRWVVLEDDADKVEW